MGRIRIAAVAAGAVTVLAAGCGDEPAPTYDEAFKAEFTQACLAEVGGGSGARVCDCWYERLRAEVPFDELPALDDLVASDVSEDAVDPALYDRLAACVRAFGDVGGVPATAPPPLTVPRPSTTTTTLVLEG